MPALFDLAKISADDVVVDIGCGDGRLVSAASTQFGCRGIGVERDGDLVELARERVRSDGVEDPVNIEVFEKEPELVDA